RDEPDQAKSCFPVLTPPAAAPEKKQGRRKEEAPRQKVPKEKRSVEPPGMVPMRRSVACEPALEVVFPEKGVEPCAVRLVVGPDEPGADQRDYQRHSPPDAEAVRQREPATELPG